LVVVMGYGGAVHLVQVTTGNWPPYSWAPAWLAVYFSSLTMLDPLAALLLARRRAVGLYLVVLVLVTDAIANWYATYRLPHSNDVARIAQAVISVLALASLAVARLAHPWMFRRWRAGTKART